MRVFDAILTIAFGCTALNCSKSVDNVSDVYRPSERQLYKYSSSSSGFNYNPPTLVGSYIYIGTSRHYMGTFTDDNFFFKLNLTLQEVWKYSLGTKEVRGGAVLDDFGNIYFVVDQRTSETLDLYSLTPDGEYRWSRRIDSTTRTDGMLNPAITDDNIIYVGGNKLYAFDSLGTELWSWPAENRRIRNAPIIDPNGNIYFNAGGLLVSLDKSGAERWFQDANMDGPHFSSPAFSTDYSKIYIGIGNSVYCLRANDGQVIWTFEAEADEYSYIPASPAVDDLDNVYIGTHGYKSSTFYAIRSDGSGLLWKTKIGADMYSSPALGDDNTVYVGSEWTDSPKRLHALDMKTGAIKWSANLETDPTFSSAAISDEGILYIATMTCDDLQGQTHIGAIYAFKTDCAGLLSTAGWPRFHGGNSNSGRRE